MHSKLKQAIKGVLAAFEHYEAVNSRLQEVQLNGGDSSELDHAKNASQGVLTAHVLVLKNAWDMSQRTPQRANGSTVSVTVEVPLYMLDTDRCEVNEVLESFEAEGVPFVSDGCEVDLSNLAFYGHPAEPCTEVDTQAIIDHLVEDFRCG